MPTARAILCSGDIYTQRYENGAWLEREGPFEGGSFAIKPNVELKNQISKGRGRRGQIVESVSIAQPFDFEATFREVNKTTLAINLLGTTEALAQSAGSLAEEAVVAKLGYWVPLSKAALTGSPTVTNSAEDTTYVNGTDYLVNPQMGWFKALPGGAITNNQALKFSSAYGAISGDRIKGNTAPTTRVRMVLDGKNDVDETPIIVTIHELIIAPSDAFDFLGDDFGEIKVSGNMKTPAGYTEPFTVDIRNAA
jgi:hypothetical protein